MRLTETFSAAMAAGLLQAYRKPLAFLLGLVLLPLVLVAVLTYRFSVRLQQEQAFHNLGVTASLAAEIVRETLDHTVQLEQVLASQPGFAAAVVGQDQAWLTERLQGALALAPRISSLAVVNPDGLVVAAVPQGAARVGQPLGQAAALEVLRRQAWQPYVSPVYFEPEPQPRKIVSIFSPVFAEGRIVGAVQAEHEVEEVRAWLQKIRVEPAGFLYVVDHEQQLVVYPFQVLPGRPKVVADWPTVRAALPESGATLAFRDARSGQRWLAGLHPLPALGWRVVAVQPLAAVLKILHDSLRAMAVLLALLAIVLVAVSLRWAQMQDASLQLLKQNTKLLKEMQQRMLLERGRKPPPPPSGAGGG